MASPASSSRVVDMVERMTRDVVSTRICYGTVVGVAVSGSHHLVTVQIGSSGDSTIYPNLSTISPVSVGDRVAWLQSSTGTSIILGTLW